MTIYAEIKEFGEKYKKEINDRLFIPEVYCNLLEESESFEAKKQNDIEYVDMMIEKILKEITK